MDLSSGGGESSGLGGIILLCLAVVTFRPKDAPVIARAAGRLVGGAVRGARHARDAVGKAAVEAAEADGGGEAKKKFAQSYRAAEDIFGRLRKEVEPLRFDMGRVAKGLRKEAAEEAGRKKTIVGKRGKNTGVKVEKGLGWATAENVAGVKAASVISAEPGAVLSGDKLDTLEGVSGECGADVLSGVIEEAAFAEQAERFGRRQ